MTGYKVLNKVNAHAVCVFPVVQSPILSCYITLWNVCYKTIAFARIYNFEFSLSFEFRGDALLHVQPTVFFKIRLTSSITVSVKERCR